MITSGMYQLFRNGVLVSQGTMLGSTTFSYNPPDANPATYDAYFKIPGGSGGTLYRRSINIQAQKR